MLQNHWIWDSIIIFQNGVVPMWNSVDVFFQYLSTVFRSDGVCQGYGRSSHSRNLPNDHPASQYLTSITLLHLLLHDDSKLTKCRGKNHQIDPATVAIDLRLAQSLGTRRVPIVLESAGSSAGYGGSRLQPVSAPANSQKSQERL